MKRLTLKKPSLPKRSKSTDAARANDATKTTEAPKQSAAKRPGLFDSMRDGWLPAETKMAGKSAASAGAAKTASRGGVATDGASTAAQPVTRPELAEQRDQLARQFAELQWDLGGIVYEMSSRKDFKPEVLDKQVAKLSEIDVKLGQVERVIRIDQEGAAGTCPSCGALQARGAVFCWKCGKEQKPAANAAAGKSETPAKPEAK